MPPKRRLPEPYVLIVIDDDKQQFTVEGPMRDDTGWTKAVYDAAHQKDKRSVRCYEVVGKTVEHAASDFKKENAHKQVASGTIVSPRISKLTPLPSGLASRKS